MDDTQNIKNIHDAILLVSHRFPHEFNEKKRCYRLYRARVDYPAWLMECSRKITKQSGLLIFSIFRLGFCTTFLAFQLSNFV